MIPYFNQKDWEKFLLKQGIIETHYGVPMNRYDEENFGDKGRPRHGSPEFYKILQEMAELHDKKSHDYAADGNPYGNYFFAGKLAALFAYSHEDAGFVGRMGEKLYRLANLESNKKTPQNETIEDTEKDLCVIMALWIASRRERRKRDKGPGDITEYK